MSKIVTARIAEYTPKQGNRPHIFKDSVGVEYSTFKDSIAEQAKPFVGQEAALTYSEVVKGNFTNNYLDSAAPTNGVAQASNGQAQAAPVDTRPVSVKDEQVARSVAWKAVSNDAFLKALLSTYSLSNPGEQLDHIKLHSLLTRQVTYITNDILGTGDVPF